MRFDQFIEQSGIAVSPVDSIDGFIVDVGLPSEWAPLDSVHGVRVWIWRCDPHITEFCANAVLTMHCIDAPLEAGEMFAMLSEQQAHMLSGSRIEQNELGAAKEGPGFTGTFAMIFASPFGPIGSVSRSRIITADRRTLVAQLRSRQCRIHRLIGRTFGCQSHRVLRATRLADTVTRAPSGRPLTATDYEQEPVNG